MASGNGTHQLRIVLEQNGLINLFSVSFAFLLFCRKPRGYHERLLLVTSCASFVADCILVFINVPQEEVLANLGAIQFMTFVAVVCWTVRELGLLLYTNKIVQVLEIEGRDPLYHWVFRGVFSLLLLWRVCDAGLRTSDPATVGAAGNVVRTLDPVYLATLSCLEIWNAIFLIKLAVKQVRVNSPGTTVHAYSSKVMSTGVLRVVAINLFPLIRCIISRSMSSSFEYSADASSIIYYLQVSMNLMYLIDLVLVKLDTTSIFRGETTVSAVAKRSTLPQHRASITSKTASLKSEQV